MEEQRSGLSVSAEQPGTEQVIGDASTEPTDVEQNGGPSAEKAGTEQRKAYGTAKTENLRDSGLWRLLIPALVVILCLVLIAVPLIILVPLLYNSITAPAGSSLNQLIWLWITMIVMEMGIVALVIWGFFKIFMTQAGNYSK